MFELTGWSRRPRTKPLISLALVVLLSLVATAGADDAETPAQRASFALGHQIGSDLVRQGRSVDVDALRRGLRDAVDGRAAALAAEERNDLLLGLKRGIVATDRAARLRGAWSLRETGERFMAENARREGVVVLESGVQYRVLRKGDGPRPGPEDRVSVRYRSTRLDGTPFHDSLRPDAAPETFRVGAVIEGLGEALQHMPEGSRWEIVIPPDLAFGRRGALQDQTVVYDLELHEVAGSVKRSGEEGS
jgi:FKBP-type peptidyl-prolyl cis-trans isomerase FklB